MQPATSPYAAGTPQSQLYNAYQQYLGRAPEAGAIENMRSDPVDQQIQSLENSPEAKSYLSQGLNSAYQQYLGRAPEAGALENMRTNDPLLSQVQAIQNSPEAKDYTNFQNLSKPTDTSGSQGALQAYLSAVQGQQNPLDILTAREQTLGIPAAQQQVSGLRQAITNTTNLLNKISPAVQGRTATSLINSAQANRITQNEQAPVQGQLSKLGQDYGLASADLGQLNTQALNEANLANEGQQQKLAGLGQAFNMASTQQNAAESIRQFNLGQLVQKQQFNANLDIQKQQFGLSQKQADEARREFDLTQSEQQRQFNAQQALQQQTLAEQIRSNQANESISASKGSGGSDGTGLGPALAALLTGGGTTGGDTTAPAATTTPIQQAAYNDVQTRVNNQTDGQLMSDYLATAASAKNGNATDLAKLQIYRALKPDLFKAKYSWEK